MGTGREVHGVYFTDNKRLIVREFYDMQVPHWEFTKALPWKTFTIITDESEAENFRFDFNGRLYKKLGVINKIKSVGVLLDGEYVSCTDAFLNSVFEIMLSVIHEATRISATLSGNELLLQHIRSQFYILEPVVNGLGLSIDVTVPDEIIDGVLNAKSQSSSEVFLNSLKQVNTKEERLSVIKKYIDPGNVNK